MNNKYRIIPTLVCLIGLFFLLVSCRFSNEEKKPPPNIVFFFVDDMGWQDTSEPFHTEQTKLNQQYFTPNMEKLADEGIKFTQAYACAICSPSRVSLMTGMNAARHRVTNWTLRKGKSPDGNHPIIQPPEWNLNGLSGQAGEERTIYTNTLPQLLKQAGYKTIHAGKAHFGAKGTSGENPLNLGFDVNIAGHAAGGPGSYYGKYNYSAAWRNADRIWDVPGLEKYHGTDTYLTEALTLEVKEEISKAVEEKQPFYLYMSHYAIHAPWERDERYFQKFKEAGLSDFDATYASMLEGMDKSLGDIRTHLKELGVDEETIVVFMSDNGAPKQAARNLPLRGHKITPYEGGIRVPMMVKWPGITNPKVDSHNYLIIEDIFPTFLEMAGLKEEALQSQDGISFLPLLTGEGEYPKSRPIYWHYPNVYDQPPYSSMRKGAWKLIYHHIDRKLELFNLEMDLSEKNDLSKDHPEKLNELVSLLSDYLIESKAQMPFDKKKNVQVEYPNEILRSLKE